MNKEHQFWLVLHMCTMQEEVDAMVDGLRNIDPKVRCVSQSAWDELNRFVDAPRCQGVVAIVAGLQALPVGIEEKIEKEEIQENGFCGASSDG